MFSIKHPWRASALLGVAVLASAGGVVALGGADAAVGSQQTVASQAQADAAQLPAVKSAFAAAIQASRAAQAPPASALGPMSALAAGRPAAMVSDAVRSRQLSDGLAVLGKHFTAAQARHEAAGLRNAIAGEADPSFRNLGSGASKVTFTRVGVSGPTATIQAEVTLWAKFQQRINGRWVTENPVNVMDYTATLVRNASGQWLVSSLTGDFANEGP